MTEGFNGERVLNGCGASPGIVIGPVRNIGQQDPELASHLQPGEVLVAEGHRLYPAVPDGTSAVDFFRRALAFVTDRGGRTCSVAIIARELGVPAVTGTREATGLLKTGQIVVVDGTQGAVYSLAKNM